jgi:hypothetical protein
VRGRRRGEERGRKSIFAGEISEIADITEATSVAEPEQTRLKASLEASRKRRFRAVHSVVRARGTQLGLHLSGQGIHLTPSTSRRARSTFEVSSGASVPRLFPPPSPSGLRSALLGGERCIRLYSALRAPECEHDRELPVRCSSGGGIGCFRCFPLSVKHTVSFRARGVERPRRLATRTQRRQTNASDIGDADLEISRETLASDRQIRDGTQANLYIAQKEENSWDERRSSSRSSRLKPRGFADSGGGEWRRKGREGGGRSIVAAKIGNYFYTSATIIKLVDCDAFPRKR